MYVLLVIKIIDNIFCNNIVVKLFNFVEIAQNNPNPDPDPDYLFTKVVFKQI